MRIQFISILFLLSVLVVPFSVSQENPQWKGKIEYENEIKVIKNPEEPLYGEITLDLEKELTIGNAEDEDCYFFKNVSTEIDSDGNILILDSGNNRIQKFDKNGAYLQTIGRTGQGPGEFSDPSWIYLDSEDNLYVKDSREVEIFDKKGEFKTTYTFPFNISRFSITSEGNVLAQSFSRGIHHIHVLNSEWKEITTIGSFPSLPYSILINPYLPYLWFCQINEELAVYGYSSEYKLSVLNSSGEVIYIIEKKELPGDKSLKNKEKEKLISYHLEIRRARGKDIDNRARSMVEKTLPFPEQKASYFRTFCDDKNRIYVRQVNTIFTEEENAEYDMFSKDGYYLYRIKIPLSIGYGPWGLIKNGYLYDVVEDQETFNKIVIKYKIRNWDQIKVGI